MGEENTRLKARLAEYEPKLKLLQQHESELTSLRVRISQMEPELVNRNAKLRTYADENRHLQVSLEKIEPQITLLEKELKSLRSEVASRNSQVQDWETRFTSVVSQKDAELSECRSRVAELDGLLSKPAAKPAVHHVVHHVPAKHERDDLKKIYGIGPVLEKRLNDLGVYFFREIALWTKEDIVRFEEHLKEFPDRIERDNWVEGAREEHFKKYGERLSHSKSTSA